MTQRRQEIGIRIALGASASSVRGSIVQSTLALAAAGVLLGVAGALIVVPAHRASRVNPSVALRG